MSNARKLVLSISLSFASLCIASCNKTKDYELQEINDVSTQILSFTLSSSNNTGLAKHVFAIKNTPTQGAISNSVPLPYGTELNDVLLNIGTVAGQENTIRISINGAAEEEWTSTKTYTIPQNAELIIKVTNKAKSEYSYSYKVKINQYSYDPESISWRQVANGSLPLFNSGASGSVFTLNGENYLTAQGGSSVYSLSNNALPAPSAINGLSAGETIKRVLSDNNKVYALGTSGKLYSLTLQSGAWQAQSLAEGIYELVGIFPDKGDASPRLALLCTPSRTANLDNSLAVDRRLLFATYSHGAGVKVSEHYVPANFPGLDPRDVAYSFSKGGTYVGDKLEIIASSSSQEAGKSYRTMWFTDSGQKWAAEYSELVERPQPNSMSALLVGDTYYRIESNSSGLSIYYSLNKKDWTLSKEIALQGLNQASLANAQFVAWSNNDNIYILQSNGTTSTLWQGEILKRRI